MNMREAIIAALRRDPELLPKVAGRLRERIDEKDGAMATVVQSAGALEPVIRDAVRRRPSKLGALGLKSAHMLALLAADDRRSNSRLQKIAEKGTVGIVFVDIANFTSFTADNGDKAAIRVISALNDLIHAAIKPARGECVKHLGDGFLLAFPSASQAVRGASAIRVALDKRRGSTLDEALQVRIAVHAGEPSVEQDDLLGHDVNLTARLLDHCDPEEIIVSAAAKELAERRLKKIRFSRPRTIKIRGLTTPVTVFSV
ncbi:MAG TPA: adenylate/guanylate cyclase domain-containing protein [Actinomycetota bacterium]|nr:adenylate/guanylate cyclase domain-containing protein [Actinomycetota bacterium]